MLPSVLGTLLIISVATAQGSPDVAPAIDLSLDGLPAPLEQEDGSVLLPPELADALDTQREQCRQLPALCQAQLDAVNKRNKELMATAHDLGYTEGWNDAPRGHSLSLVIAVGAGGVAVGIIGALLAILAVQ